MRYALYLLLIVLSGSCERTVEVDLPREPARLVVNAFFTPDSLMRVQVSQSMSVLERPRILGITDAEVKIYEDEKEIATLKPDSLHKYVYISDEKLVRAGKTYGIRVTSPDYEPVSAENYVPSAVNIKRTTLNESAGTDLSGSFYNTLRIELDDPAGEENYYAVQVKAVEYELIKNRQTGANDTVRREFPGDLFREPTVSGIRAEKQLLFSDQQFDGSSTSLLSYFYPFKQQGSGNQAYVIYLLSVSKMYYEYYKRLPDHLMNQSFEILGGEVVPMPNNIANGYGVFAGYSFDRVEYR